MNILIQSDYSGANFETINFQANRDAERNRRNRIRITAVMDKPALMWEAWKTIYIEHGFSTAANPYFIHG